MTALVFIGSACLTCGKPLAIAASMWANSVSSSATHLPTIFKGTELIKKTPRFVGGASVWFNLRQP
jgi:hypothetical protein